MLRKLLFLFCLLFFLFGNVRGQFFTHGQESSSIKWMQARGNKYTLIFPESYKDEAIRFAGFLNASIDSNGSFVRKRIPVVLHPWNPQSNGFVTLAPRRMELNTTPPQDVYPQEWIAQLALHEYRHVIQLDQLNHGLVRFGSSIFGEQGWGLAASLVPQWFYEGDAVLAETQFSRSGRGRLPSFYQGHRTAFLSGKKYSYDKWLMGSYKDYVPNHYELGYKLVAFGEMKYGAKVWESIMSYTSRRPYTLVPFYFGLKRYAGVSRQQLFSEAFHFLDSTWRAGSEVTIREGRILLAEFDDSYFNDKYPVFINDSTLITYRSGLKLSPRLIKMQLSGASKTVIHTNYLYDPIGCNRSVVVWNEYLPSYRWGQQGISKIKIFDTERKRTSAINSSFQLFSPAINHSGSQLVAVGVAESGAQSLVFFDINSGKVSLVKGFPIGDAIQNPSWDSTDSIVSYTKVDDYGKSLCSYTSSTNNERILFGPSATDISSPVYWRNYILFTSYNSQVNNIFAIDTLSKKLYRITSSTYGCENATLSPNGKLLAFSCYTPNGLRVAVASMDTLAMLPVADSLNYVQPFEQYLTSKPSFHGSDSLDNSPILISPYKKGLNLFKIHSWAPFFYDPLQLNVTSLEFKPGLTLMSQNILSTTLAALGVSFDGIHPNFHGRLIYQEWFPVFSLSADYGALTYVYRDGNANYSPVAKFDRLDITGSISLPINLTQSRFLQSVVPSVSVNHTNDYFYNRIDSMYVRTYTLITYNLSYYLHTPMAVCDIRPPWATMLNVRYRNSPLETENTGSIFSFQVRQMTPGLFANHSIMLSLGYQDQQLEKYYLSSTIPLPRGYQQFSTTNLKTGSVEYAFPLVYMDFAIPNFIYLKRVNANVFSDWASDSYLVYNKTLNRRELRSEYLYSYGIDLGFDYHLFRNSFPISTTLRFGDTRNNEPFFNFFFGISFN